MARRSPSSPSQATSKRGRQSKVQPGSKYHNVDGGASSSCISRSVVRSSRVIVFPFLLKYIDVNRQTKTNFYNFEESSIEDYRNADGNKTFSEEWIGLTHVEILWKRAFSLLMGKRNTESHGRQSPSWLKRQTNEKGLRTSTWRYLRHSS